MAGAVDILSDVAALRGEFDAGFAVPPRPPPPDLVPLLVVRVGGTVQAIALAELMSFTACGVVVPLPRQPSACLGLTAFRGKPIPVFDLAALLGRGAREASPRWLAVTQAGIGFAVAELVGLVHVPPDELRQDDGSGQRMVGLASGLCPLVDLHALSAASSPSAGARIP
jgi:chemotaxis signal transduction protein